FCFALVVFLCLVFGFGFFGFVVAVGFLVVGRRWGAVVFFFFFFFCLGVFVLFFRVGPVYFWGGVFF
ncbi:hypothetical protein ACWKWJ_17205, partial [Sphingopyxis terrae subsp. ummariensis]